MLNKRNRSVRNRLAMLLAVLLAVGCLSIPVAAVDFRNDVSATENATSAELPAYADYLEAHRDAAESAEIVTLNGADYSATDMKETALPQHPDAAHVAAEGYIEWPVSIPAAGMYQLEITYIAEGQGAVERSLLLDGKLPFQEARFITLNGAWQDADGAFPTDSAGNQMRPDSFLVGDSMTERLSDPMGYYTQPLSFFLTEGAHKLRLESVRGALTVLSLSFCPGKPVLSYAEYHVAHPANPGADTQFLEAEDCYQKSEFSIYPYNDRESHNTSPQDPSKVLLNVIGGNKWANAGQWISWRITVKTPGRYYIVPRARQNIKNGVFVSRSLYINGELPFAEAGALRFVYHSGWQKKPLSGLDGTPLSFYFTPGEYTLTMQVVLGDLAPIVREADDIMRELTAIYREVLMITGVTPDLYRDYDFKNMIPDAIDNISVQKSRIDTLCDSLYKITGTRGEDMALLNRISFQLKTMEDDPESIARLFSSFGANVSALGSWVLEARSQPLELDSLTLSPADGQFEGEKKHLFSQLWFSIQSFIYSFLTDYNTVGGGSQTANVEVWVNSGRDQAQIIKALSEDTLPKTKGIGVSIKLVSAGTMLPSVLAGVGPDVSLFNSCTDPINYATRKAAVDLSGFDGFDEVIKRFPGAAMTSYQFGGGTYALPETIVFPMLFYRKDIFEQMSLTLPETWQDFYALIPELQKNHMQVGYPVNLTGLEIFLYQAGHSLYSDDLTRSMIDDDAVLDAFVRLTDLYTAYRFPPVYDLANRFRTGEMPMAVADYTLCNQLSVFAPEIKGQWAFIPLPQTIRADGTRSGVAPVTTVGASTAFSASVGGGAVVNPAPSTGVMMLSGAKNREAAWAFMDWWTSEDTQVAFCTEMEAVIGVAAKQPTANINALARLPWTSEEYKNLSIQFERLAGTPEVPGGYYISRYYDFAFNDVYTNKLPAVPSLLKYKKAVNGEITRKRREFGLDK